MTAVYLVLGLVLIGGLYYALTQITARQRRLNAELTRLERLAAEVSMNAEAILDRVDERIDRLNELTTDVESRMNALRTAVAEQSATLERTGPEAKASSTAKPEAAPEPSTGTAPKQRKSRKKTHPAPDPEVTVQTAPEAAPAASSEPSPAEVASPAKTTSLDRYQQLRTAVFTLADQGKGAGEIAQELGVPRGEVQLILNLRGRKVTA